MKTFSRWTVIISLYIVQLTFAQEYTKTLLGNGFSSPFSLYVDTSGTIYIPDYKNNQVKKMDANGENIQSLSFNFQRPTGITMDADGRLLISEISTNKIKRMGTDGSNNETIISTGINSPMGLVFDSQGNLLVADNGNHAVRKINLTTGVKTVVATGFFNVSSIAVDNAGNIYVADSTSKITRIKPNGTKESLGSGFVYANAVTVDSAGNIYVADAQPNNAIKKMDNNGGNVQTIAETYSPNGIFVDNHGNVYVSGTYDTSPIIKLSPPALGTSEFLSKKIIIYPNPAKNKISFSENLRNIKIFDESGKSVLIKNNTETIDISYLSQGTYFINGVNTDGKTVREKFIKE